MQQACTYLCLQQYFQKHTHHQNTSSNRSKFRNKIVLKIFAATCYLIKCVCSHVQHDRPIKNTAPQFKETVQRQSCYIRLAPSITTIFNILFKLQPPEMHSHIHLYSSWKENLASNPTPLYGLGMRQNRKSHEIIPAFIFSAQLINIFNRSQ